MNRTKLISAAVAVFALTFGAFAPGGVIAEPLKIAQAGADTVCFNTQNHKFHALSCLWAKRCTVHCIEISRAEAHKQSRRAQGGSQPIKISRAANGFRSKTKSELEVAAAERQQKKFLFAQGPIRFTWKSIQATSWNDAEIRCQEPFG